MSFAILLLTFVHVAISLAAIVAGFVVMYGLVVAKRLERWTAFFLATTVATSVTGFFFPVDHFMPSHAFGILSLVILAVAIIALYSHRLNGAWRIAYAIGAVTALYLNVVVLVVQAFQKVPALQSQADPLLVVTQTVTLTAFLILGVFSVLRFHLEAMSAAPALVLAESRNGRSLPGRPTEARLTHDFDAANKT
jgi:hypothetical protein